MALHYIVDGYNVIRKTAFLDCEKLKDARQALLRFIDTFHPQGSSANKITVVFDARESCFDPSHFDIAQCGSKRGERSRTIYTQDQILSRVEGFDLCYNCDSRVVFTKGESADDYITSLVDKARNARTMRIVSDDRELTLNCRSRGAEAISVRDFIETSRKKMRASQKKAEGFFELSYSERRKINEELAKIWLK